MFNETNNLNIKTPPVYNELIREFLSKDQIQIRRACIKISSV